MKDVVGYISIVRPLPIREEGIEEAVLGLINFANKWTDEAIAFWVAMEGGDKKSLARSLHYIRKIKVLIQPLRPE
jgi:hypothetical protein